MRMRSTKSQTHIRFFSQNYLGTLTKDKEGEGEVPKIELMSGSSVKIIEKTPLQDKERGRGRAKGRGRGEDRVVQTVDDTSVKLVEPYSSQIEKYKDHKVVHIVNKMEASHAISLKPMRKSDMTVELAPQLKFFSVPGTKAKPMVQIFVTYFSVFVYGDVEKSKRKVIHTMEWKMKNGIEQEDVNEEEDEKDRRFIVKQRRLQINLPPKSVNETTYIVARKLDSIEEMMGKQPRMLEAAVVASVEQQ